MIRKASFMVLGFFVLSCTVLTVVAGTKSIGSKFEGFSLRDTNGNIRNYQNLKGNKGTAIMFLSSRCPVVNRYNQTIDSIARSYAARGINFIGIYSSDANSTQKRNFTSLIDDSGIVTNQLGARYTPELFVFNEADVLVYKGAIDDNSAGQGVRNHFARIALESVLAGAGVARNQTQAFGCSIRSAAYVSANRSTTRGKSVSTRNANVARRVETKPVKKYKAQSARQNSTPVNRNSAATAKFSRTGNPKPYSNAVAKNIPAQNQIVAKPVEAKKKTRVSGFVTRRKQTGDDENIAQQLANPISPLLRIPVTVDYNDRVGAAEQPIWQVSVEPVIPIKLGDNVNLISRTKVPTIRERDVPLQGTDTVAGLGDIEQTFLFTPARSGVGGLSWGIGPSFLLNTSTDGRFGRRKWGVGPAGALVLQNQEWTVGLLANHIKSFAGDDDRRDVNETFANPFISSVFGGRTTVTLKSGSTYDWEDKDWTVPVDLTLSQLLMLGNQGLQIGGGPRYWATSPVGGPRGWGFSIGGTLVFPRK